MGIRFQPSEAEGVVSAGRRSEPRARVALGATFETLSGQKRGFLLNLSVHGAMVTTDYSPKCGSNLLLKCGELDVLATAVWCHDGHIGLMFDEPIDEQEIIELRRRADHLAEHGYVNRPGRPALSARPLTAAELKAADDWATIRD